jgi:hypothetical protein
MTTWASAGDAGGHAGARVKDATALLDLGRVKVDQRGLIGRARLDWWGTFLEAAFHRAGVTSLPDTFLDHRREGRRSQEKAFSSTMQGS